MQCSSDGIVSFSKCRESWFKVLKLTIFMTLENVVVLSPQRAVDWSAHSSVRDCLHCLCAVIEQGRISLCARVGHSSEFVHNYSLLP